MRTFLFLIVLLSFIPRANGQERITILKTARYVTLKHHLDSTDLQITLFQPDTVSPYNYISIQASKNSKNRNIADELPYIKELFDTAFKSFTIRLNSISAPYPWEYFDLLSRQHKAFNNDAWRKNYNPYKRTYNYSMIDRLMFENRVYEDLEKLLANYGYRIRSLTTEKHGVTTKKELEKRGIKSDTDIPMPFMVYLILAKK